MVAVDAVSGVPYGITRQGASTRAPAAVAQNVIYVPSNGITALAPGAQGGAPEQLWQSKQTNPSTISRSSSRPPLQQQCAGVIAS
jgi:hypothetical protein